MNHNHLSAFKFSPILKSVLWGGNKIAPFKGITTTQQNIGESWEISGVKGNESVVAEGDDKGLTLPQLIEKYGAALVGEAAFKKFGTTFPLLIKFIDAEQDLSVQVHPDDALARTRHNSFGKTEMWYIVSTEPGAIINAGLSKAITPDDYEQMIADSTIEDAIAHHSSKPGDVFFLPAGRIHSIAAGNFLLEVQQTSDITYRIFDFNRVDASGNQRELHTALAKDAIDYKVYDSYVSTPGEMIDGESPLVSCNYFTVKRFEVETAKSLDLTSVDSFVAMICVDGNATAKDNAGNITTIKKGETILIPAATTSIELNGKATLITATC